MKRILLIIIIICSFLCNVSFCEFNSSEMFNKTIKKIAKQQVKEAIIKWVEKQDLISGIVARDLIGQMLDNKDPDQIIKSAVDVAGVMVFLNEYSTKLTEIISKDVSSPNIVTQAQLLGWNKEQLLAYTGLYIYYKQRETFKLYVPPYLDKLLDTTAPIIKKLKYNNKSWNAIIFGEMGKQIAVSHDIIYDVRTYELFGSLVSDKILGKTITLNMKSNFMENYCNTLQLTTQNNWQALISKNIVDGDELLSLIVNPIISNHRNNFNKALEDGESFISFNLRLTQQLLQPLIGFSSSLQSGMFAPAQSKQQIISSITEILNSWLEQYKANMAWQLDYSVLLGITGYDDHSINATVLDQFKYYLFSNDTYFWVGGFLDPIIKNMSGSSKKYFQFGLGLKIDKMAYCFSIGYPDGVIDPNLLRYGVSIGYTISLDDLDW